VLPDGAKLDAARPDSVKPNASNKDYAALEYTVIASCPVKKTGGAARYNDGGYGDFGLVSLVRVGLITGKPHQIRAQFAFIGHPVLGDRKYGVRRDYGGDIPGPALWAASIEFTHPVGKPQGQTQKNPLSEIATCASTHAREQAPRQTEQSPLRISAPPPDEYPWNLFAGYFGELDDFSVIHKNE
jgi:hypothetical protein